MKTGIYALKTKYHNAKLKQFLQERGDDSFSLSCEAFVDSLPKIEGVKYSRNTAMGLKLKCCDPHRDIAVGNLKTIWNMLFVMSAPENGWLQVGDAYTRLQANTVYLFKDSLTHSVQSKNNFISMAIQVQVGKSCLGSFRQCFE